MASTSELLQKYYCGLSIKEVIEKKSEQVWKGNVKPISCYTKLQLPYEAPQHPKIPPIDEIEEAIRQATILDRKSSYSGRVCTIGSLFIKRSACVAIVQEAENLLYLQASGSELRTPTVYAVIPRDVVIEDETYHVYYLVLERIEGQALTDEFWLDLEQKERQKICNSLAEQFRLLQAIQPPANCSYGRVHNQGWLEFSPMLETTNDELCGPYSSYDEFCQATYTSAELQTGLYCQPDPVEEQIRPGLLAKFRNALCSWSSRPTFTHVDPHIGNTIARRIPSTTEDGEDSWEVTLIDWEGAGWFPDWMQKTMLRECTWFVTVVAYKAISHKQEDHEYLEMVSVAWDKSYEEQQTLFRELKDKLRYMIHGKW